MSAADTILRWRRDPVSFVRECFEVEPDEWQKDALMAFSTHERIAMKACAGPGKTAVEAWMGWNFLLCYGGKGEHPKGYALSCTADNLETNLWPELSKWQQRSPILTANFTWTKQRVFANCHPETWFIQARTFPKTANPDEQGRTLSGLHSEYVILLVDESGDIHPSVMRAGEQAMGGARVGRFVTAGNTTSHEGMLYACCTTARSSFYIISITADPDDPKRTPRVSADWAREQIETYGRDNPWVMAYILGQFPPSSLNAILSLDEVETAMRRDYKEHQFSWSQKRLGVDVARFGDDRSVIFPRQGLVAFPPDIMRNMRTTDISARVAQAKVRWRSDMEFVDDTGHWGHGVIDNLVAAGYSPVGIQFHGKPVDPRYKNKRAEMWLSMAEWVKGGGALPPIPELVSELTAPTYTFNQGKLQLEDKDLVKQRIGRSPDLADALALTFALPDMPRPTEFEMMQRKPHQSISEYNPMQGW